MRARRPPPPRVRSSVQVLILAGLATSLLPAPAYAQPSGPGTISGPGVVDAAYLLRRLDGIKRVLMIGAHPDDEDASLLTALARGLGAETAYLSLTRGEGGQNLVGPELGEGLGLVRTGELLAARRVDGARQFFTRAFDFGYSKSAAESFRHWPRDSVLSDVVWAIRVFRPQVIISVFSGTPADGHGQHQVAGLLAREAFEAASDPARFPRQVVGGVEAWTALKLYRRTWRDPSEATLVVETGRLDPLAGRSHFQLAMRSRSQHRSQDFGTAEPAGPHVTLLRLVESRVSGPDTALFAGIDTTLAGAARTLEPPLRQAIEADLRMYRDGLARARRDLSALSPSDAVAPLLRSLAALRRVRRQLGPAASVVPLSTELEARLRILQETILAAAGVMAFAEADDDMVVPGQVVRAWFQLWNGGPFEVEAEGTELLAAPEGWRVIPDPSSAEGRANRYYPRSLDEARRLASASAATDTVDEAVDAEAEPGERPRENPGDWLSEGRMKSWGFRVELPADAPPLQPYFLAAPRAGDLYRWPADPELRGLPLDPPALNAALQMRLRAGSDSASIEVSRPVRFRLVDKAAGESWRPILLVPAVSVSIDPHTIVWPLGVTAARPVVVTLRAESPDGFEGRLRLLAPQGWEVTPPEQRVELEAPGAVRTYLFELRRSAPDRAASAPRSALEARVVGSDGTAYEQELVVVDYPHIEPMVYLRPAETTLQIVDVAVDAGRRIGYVMGSGDQVPEAIRQLGIPVEMIAPGDLESNGLARFDVIVLGVRAYETRPDLAAANESVLDWVRGGGVLIVQYNKYELPEGGYAPFPLTIARPHGRVTDEAASVAVLEPDAPLFLRPNRITDSDFEGWIQERGLYFLSDWDQRYLPLLAMADSGEEPLRGGLVVARLGRGLWVYTGLALFRQLPAGVPGAYRLLANLLALDPETWPDPPE